MKFSAGVNKYNAACECHNYFCKLISNEKCWHYVLDTTRDKDCVFCNSPFNIEEKTNMKVKLQVCLRTTGGSERPASPDTEYH